MMAQKNNKTNPQRSYPPVYEKLIPITIGVLILIIAGMLIFTIAVALGVVSWP